MSSGTVAPAKRRARKPLKSPRDIADEQLKKGQITEVVHRRKRERIQGIECSYRWSEDIWNGRDRDYLGRFTGSGTGKIRCRCCRRRVPPQDISRGQCTDCRTRAPRYRVEEDTSILGVAINQIVIYGAEVVSPALPSETAEDLSRGLERYQQTGQIEDFLDATSDHEAAEIQRQRYLPDGGQAIAV